MRDVQNKFDGKMLRGASPRRLLKESRSVRNPQAPSLTRQHLPMGSEISYAQKLAF